MSTTHPEMTLHQAHSWALSIHYLTASSPNLWGWYFPLKYAYIPLTDRKASLREVKKCVQVHKAGKRRSRNFCPRMSAPKPSWPVLIQGTQRSLGSPWQRLELVVRMLPPFFPEKDSLRPSLDLSRNRDISLDLSAENCFACLDLCRLCQ